MKILPEKVSDTKTIFHLPSRKVARWLMGPAMLSLILLSCGQAFAANSNFNPNVDNNWFTPGNWSAGVPDASQDIWATIQSGVANINAPATAGGANALPNFTVHSGAAVNILSSGSLTVTNNGYNAGNSRVLGTMNAAGDFAAGRSLHVGIDAAGSLLSIAGGTTSATNMAVGFKNANNANAVSGTTEISGSGNLTVLEGITIGHWAIGTGTVAGEFTILSGATGTVNFGTGGAHVGLVVGNAGGTGGTTATVNIHGGQFIGGSQSFIEIGKTNAATGTMNQTNGVVNVTGAGVGAAGQLRLNQEGTGSYTLSGGTLQVRDILLGSANGTTDTFTISGTDPTFTVNRNFTMGSDGIYEAEMGLSGVSAVTVAEGVSLTGGELKLSLNAFSSDFDQDILLIDKISIGAITGTFTGLANGAEIFAEYHPGMGYAFNIFYDGGTGNDVVLQFSHVVIPEPSVFLLLTASMTVLLLFRKHVRRI